MRGNLSPINNSIGGTLAMLKNVARCSTLMEQLRTRGADRPGFGVFYGHPGYGKTKSSIYVQNKSRAVLVEANDSWTKKHLLRNILIEAGVEPRGTIANMTDAAIEALGDEQRPLIIDEADKLADKGMVELIRGIQDSSDCPVLLIGEEKLPQKLQHSDRLCDRVLAFVPAEPCDIADARALADLYYPNIEIADDLLDAIRSRSGGRARRIVENLWRVSEFARNAGLSTLDAAAYGGEFYTGAVPQPRRAA